MKNNKQLINNIIGQLKGIDKMIDENRDYFQVLNQIKATKAAFNSLVNKYTEQSFNACVKDGVDPKMCKKFFNEIIKYD